MNSLKRCVIYPKDIALITGRSERYGHSLYQKVKIYFNKGPHQFVTPEEFSQFSGIPLEVIWRFLS
jgi:hypothetical protein